ncbi:MAG: hypothetical protein O9310_00105 [Leptospiraceae bacterium]|nr:hypothetical protein [Leptospiraceae bacterium]
MESNAIIELAGKETIADIAVKLITDMKINEWLSYAIGISGLAYGYFERKLRKKNIDRLGPRSAKLETLLNPDRTTSGLTNTGETRAEDK